MLQDDSIELAFSPQPTWGDFLSGWFLALTLIVVGVYALYGTRNKWINLAASLALALGAMFCFLLGLNFVPIHHHHWFVWDEDSRYDYWINWAVGLAVWGLSFLFFRGAQKIVKRFAKKTETNEN